MARGLKPDERQALDDALLSRPGGGAPSWWKGEEEAAASNAAAIAALGAFSGRR